LRGSYLKLLYKKNKLWKERRREGSAVISPCQCTVKWDKAVTDQVGQGKKAMFSQKNVSIILVEGLNRSVKTGFVSRSVTSR
jgi:hypothetical protein